MAKVGDIGTLKELGVVVGDVVEYVSGSPTHDYRLGDRYTCTIKDGELIVRYERGWFSSVEEDSWLYRIISRATPKPKIWRDMTPEEKGSLLLAPYEGKVIEYYTSRTNIWHKWNSYIFDDNGCVVFTNNVAYRIKSEPKVETVTMGGFEWNCEWHFRTNKDARQEYRITFNLIDGKPDCESVKMDVV